MAPELSGEPCTTRDVKAPAHIAAGSGISPGIGDGVGTPSSAAVKLGGSLGTIFRQEPHILEHRFVTFCKIGFVGAPVVLVDIYVEVIVARPGHLAGEVVVPYTLQVGAERRIRTGGCDLHITSILEE